MTRQHAWIVVAALNGFIGAIVCAVVGWVIGGQRGLAGGLGLAGGVAVWLSACAFQLHLRRAEGAQHRAMVERLKAAQRAPSPLDDLADETPAEWRREDRPSGIAPSSPRH